VPPPFTLHSHSGNPAAPLRQVFFEKRAFRIDTAVRSCYFRVRLICTDTKNFRRHRSPAL
jgi:hypothetical protein